MENLIIIISIISVVLIIAICEIVKQLEIQKKLTDYYKEQADNCLFENEQLKKFIKNTEE